MNKCICCDLVFIGVTVCTPQQVQRDILDKNKLWFDGCRFIYQSGYWHKGFETGNGLSIQGFYVTHATSKAGFLGI